jgi:hypothetical protein
VPRGVRPPSQESFAMSDVNTFIETIGKDVNATVVPKLETLAETVSKQTFTEYGPRISAFASQLVKDVIDEQSVTVRDFVTGIVGELFHRYEPKLTGELHATMVPGAVQVTGQGVKLELKNRQTGASVSTLDLPVSLTIRVADLKVQLQNTRIQLNVIK